MARSASDIRLGRAIEVAGKLLHRGSISEMDVASIIADEAISFEDLQRCRHRMMGSQTRQWPFTLKPTRMSAHLLLV